MAVHPYGLALFLSYHAGTEHLVVVADGDPIVTRDSVDPPMYIVHLDIAAVTIGTCLSCKSL